MRDLIKRFAGEETIALLKYPPYLFFILSVIFSQIAFNMLNVILIFLVYFLTSSNFLVSFLLLSFLIPQIFLSFVGGVFAEGRNKKNILVYANIGRAILLLLLFFNAKSILLVYFVSFFISIITQFYIPAETPMIPQLVEQENLTQANSLFGVALFGSILVGYVIAGPSIGLFGRSGVFLLVIGLLLFACMFLSFIPDRLVLEKIRGSKRNLKSDLKNSLKDELIRTYHLLKGSTEITVTFLLLGFSQIIILILATIVPGYAKTVLEVTEREISLLFFAPAAFGMIISSFLIGGILSKYDKQKLINAGIFISGIALLLFPFTSRIVSKLLGVSTIHFTVLLAFLAGFANALLFVPAQTLIQEKIPEAFRSRIYGLLFTVIGIMSLLPITIAGGVADLIGIGKVLFGIGSFVILLGTAKVKLWR